MYTAVLSLVYGFMLMTSTEELQCSNQSQDNKEISKLKNLIRLKEEQIDYLVDRLNDRRIVRETDLSRNYEFRTCMHVQPDLHLRSDNRCIHWCVEPHSCSDAVLSCYPYDNCAVKCIGHTSCHHLQIEYLDGPVILDCPGFGSCKSVSMLNLDEYNIEDQVTMKYQPGANNETFSWDLPSLELHEALEFTDENIEINPHYILGRKLLSSDMLDKIKQSAETCQKAKEHSEHREFGAGVQYEIKGHTVTFMDDCILPEVYKWAQSITLGVLQYLQQYTLEDMNDKNVEQDDIDQVKEYINNHWLYDWQNMLRIANEFESRVIEYISYSQSDNLGWHTDDGSNLTMVTALSDESLFDGGMSSFRLNPWDTREQDIRLTQNDIIFFPSIADHKVEPVSGGERTVMVFEWWDIGRAQDVGRTDPEEHRESMKQHCVNCQ